MGLRRQHRFARRRLTERNARIAVRTRRDERPLLEQFAETLGLGTVCDVRPGPGQSPVAVWQVTGARQLIRLVDVSDAAGVRGRKLRQYRAWRPAALEIGEASLQRRPRDLDLIAAARTALRQASEYVPELVVTRDPPTEREVRDAYAGVLRQWAATTTQRITAMVYEAERDPFWPSRNTIARAFGSWAAALAAAGLR
jgi:hypothetical protein